MFTVYRLQVYNYYIMNIRFAEIKPEDDREQCDNSNSSETFLIRIQLNCVALFAKMIMIIFSVKDLAK